MTDREFCYWLQGFFELESPTNLSPLQVQMIKDHLALVFNKVTPLYDTREIKGGLIHSDIPWDPKNLWFRTGVSC